MTIQDNSYPVPDDLNNSSQEPLTSNQSQESLIDENPIGIDPDEAPDSVTPEDEIEEYEYTPRAEAELKQIAMDIYHNRVFTDRHTHSPHEVGMVFMPLMFMTKAQHLGMLKIFGMIYQYYEEAEQRSINGLPIFMSFRFLDKNDADKMSTYYEEYKKMQDKILSEWGGQNVSGIKEGSADNIKAGNDESY